MNEERKKVLIITYYWPPGSGPGVQRFLKVAKYLPGLGWEPVILTVQNGSYPSEDQSLLDEIPPGLKVYRTPTLEPFALYNKLTGKKGKNSGVGMMNIYKSKNPVKKLSLFIRANLFIPDARKGWVPFAYKKAKHILKHEKVDAVVTTGPPHSTHLAGLKLKKKFNLPWLTDVRDPWSTIYYNQFLPRTKKASQKDKMLEDAVISHADYVTVVSPGLKDEFADRTNHIDIIYNGYDHEDIPKPSVQQSDKFILSYIGNLKSNQNIVTFWEGISELCKEVDGFKENLTLQLTGNLDDSVKEELQKLNLLQITNIQPFLPHNEATKLMDTSHLLLFVVPKAERNKLIITGKLFEYIAVRTPILSIGPVEGDASRILTDSGRDAMHDYVDKKGIKDTIMKYYNHWLENDRYNFKHPATDFNRYSRYALAEKFANILKSIIP